MKDELKIWFGFCLHCCTKCLTELRDKIFCTADGMILGDHSDNPDQLSQSTAKVCIIDVICSLFTTAPPPPWNTNTSLPEPEGFNFFLWQQGECALTHGWEQSFLVQSDRFVSSLVDVLIILFYSQDIFKSGFFFIEGVFYNDKRDPLSRDYSK